MLKEKIFFVCAIVLFALNIAVSQEGAATSGASDSAALPNGFSTVCNNIASHKTMKGSFNQEKTVVKAARTIKSSGEFFFCESGILWKTTKPVASSLLITPRKMIQTNRKGETKETDIRSNAAFTGVFTIIRALLGGDEKTIGENFSIDYKEGAANAWDATLKPSLDSMKKAIDTIAVGGKDDKSIDKISVTQVGGDKVTYTFTNTAYSDSMTDEERAIFEQ